MRVARIAAAIVAATFLLSACTSAEAGWTYAPPPSEPPTSGAPSGEPASPAPSGSPSGTVVQVSAVNIAFDQTELEIPADTPFTIEFANNDNGVPHNIQIRDSGGADLFTTDTFNGVETRTFEAPALPAGAYTFNCTIHPAMVIDVTAQ